MFSPNNFNICSVIAPRLYSPYHIFLITMPRNFGCIIMLQKQKFIIFFLIQTRFSRIRKKFTCRLSNRPYIYLYEMFTSNFDCWIRYNLIQNKKYFGLFLFLICFKFKILYISRAKKAYFLP